MNLPVPVPRTFQPGEVETGAYLNTLRDAINFLLNPPTANVYQVNAQSIPSGVFTAAALDTNIRDDYGGHNISTNNSRYTAQVAGLYGLPGQGAFGANGTGVRAVTFYKNGAQLAGATIPIYQAVTTGGSNTIITCWTEAYLNVGDYVELMVYQTSGVALNTASGGTGQATGMYPFWMHA